MIHHFTVVARGQFRQRVKSKYVVPPAMDFWTSKPCKRVCEAISTWTRTSSRTWRTQMGWYTHGKNKRFGRIGLQGSGRDLFSMRSLGRPNRSLGRGWFRDMRTASGGHNTEFKRPFGKCPCQWPSCADWVTGIVQNRVNHVNPLLWTILFFGSLSKSKVILP